MARIRETVWNIWRKNWPGVRAAFTGGLPQFILARRPDDLGSRVPVFCYHVVNAEQFEADLDFLSRNGYVTIHADPLLEHLEERRRAPERAVVLTIDDGARNLYDVAFPLLKRYGMKAVAFISPRFHGEDSLDFTGGFESDPPLWPGCRLEKCITRELSISNLTRMSTGTSRAGLNRRI